MSKLSYVKKSIITAVCMALCVVLPLAFHSIPNAGSILSPMHIPVLLCGLICGWPFGLLCGLAGSALSSFITGMPPIAILPIMMVELGTYGLIAGLMMKLTRTKNIFGDLYISLIIAMIAGRIVAGAFKALFLSAGGYSMTAWIGSYFVTPWPAIISQLILLPVIVFALEKSGLIPRRYPHKP